MVKRQINLEQSFGSALQAREIPLLQQEIEKLKQQLEQAYQQKGIEDVFLAQINPNPKQPRSSFYVVEERKSSMAKVGQKEPIVLVSPPHLESYLIFDGECRWQAAKLLGWSTIKAIIIDYNAETFDDDVFIAAISKSSINALDLADSLLERIEAKTDNFLTREKIPTILNTAITRLKRQGKQKVLGNILKHDQSVRQQLEELDLSSSERLTCQIILDYGFNPLSVNQNYFPMLKMADDIKEAIRTRGLKDALARTINKIKAQKLNISEQKARKLRRNLIDEVIQKELSLTQTNKKLKEIIAQFQPSKAQSPQLTREVKQCIKSLESIQISALDEFNRQNLIAIMQKSLAELQN